MTAGADPLSARNRLQDIWVWDGRPDWDAVFTHVRRFRSGANGARFERVGVSFCGAAVIGSDLGTACRKHSTVGDGTEQSGVIFQLHQENF